MNTVQKTCLFSPICIGLFLVLGIVHAGAQQPASKNYIIGSGDILQIQVWDHDDLNRKVEVGHGWHVFFPIYWQRTGIWKIGVCAGETINRKIVGRLSG